MDSETKQALEVMEARIMRRFDEMEKEIDGRFEQVYERIEKTETALLSAFGAWSTPIEVRLRTLP